MARQRADLGFWGRSRGDGYQGYRDTRPRTVRPVIGDIQVTNLSQGKRQKFYFTNGTWFNKHGEEISDNELLQRLSHLRKIYISGVQYV